MHPARYSSQCASALLQNRRSARPLVALTSVCCSRSRCSACTPGGRCRGRRDTPHAAVPWAAMRRPRTPATHIHRCVVPLQALFQPPRLVRHALPIPDDYSMDILFGVLMFHMRPPCAAVLVTSSPRRLSRPWHQCHRMQSSARRRPRRTPRTPPAPPANRSSGRNLSRRGTEMQITGLTTCRRVLSLQHFAAQLPDICAPHSPHMQQASPLSRSTVPCRWRWPPSCLSAHPEPWRPGLRAHRHCAEG